MTLLALETATNICSVALFRDGIVVAETTLNRPRAHAENLVPMIRDLLRYVGATPDDLNAIAVSAGPGSYTGLRIGTSTAKGLAAAVDAQLVAVASLEALAEGVRPYAETGDLIGTAFQARRDEIFAGIFRVLDDGSMAAIHEAGAIGTHSAAEWLTVESAGSIWLAGDGWHGMMPFLRSTSARLLGDVHPSAASVAKLGAQRLQKNLTENVATFEPHYLKEFVAKKPSTSAFEKLSF